MCVVVYRNLKKREKSGVVGMEDIPAFWGVKRGNNKESGRIYQKKKKKFFLEI